MCSPMGLYKPLKDALALGFGVLLLPNASSEASGRGDPKPWERGQAYVHRH